MADRETAREIRAEWVRRLRSGEYYQVKGFLRDLDNGRCCLGVLGDVLIDGKHTDAKWCGVELHRPGRYYTFLLGNEDFAKTGLSRQDDFSSMNDFLGRDFNYIADWIEKQEKELGL